MSHNCAGNVYELKTCIRCAARLVISARPSRAHQEAMLTYVQRWHGRDDVINQIKGESK